MTSSNKFKRNEVLYFAYGSNLSSDQMLKRCPKSTPLGPAYLSGWKWIINERGYANVVHDEAKTVTGELEEGTEKTRGVYGILYHLHSNDETSLDNSEGVPWAYERRFLEVEVIGDSKIASLTNLNNTGEFVLNIPEKSLRNTVQALTYVDFKRVKPGRPKDEYIYRMNNGVKDAMMKWGLPEQYVDSVIRPFIPAETKTQI
ncbi:hypothetical protein F4811DRAFT_76011 [Daldinia bambusicola]|nr:hypothetical protein F4811DRAFT_76011 [Daldinia bambusicola]